MKSRKNYNKTIHKSLFYEDKELNIFYTTACRKSTMHSGYTTNDLSKVTCKLCLEVINA